MQNTDIYCLPVSFVVWWLENAAIKPKARFKTKIEKNKDPNC